MDIRLDGKVALVTGGGAGIGRAIAEAFAELGAKVAIAEIDGEKVEALRGDPKIGADSLVIQADARKTEDVAQMIFEIDRKYGRLDILVNNVGHHLSCFKSLDMMDEAEWDALYDYNLRHLFVVTKAAIPLIRKGGRGGSIINISSNEGFRGYPSNVVYSAFKHAVTGLTKGLAVDLSSDAIRVNLIAPETTDTESVPLNDLIAPEYREAAERCIPLRRYGRPADHAGAAVYFAVDDLSSWVTGTSMLVDGGSGAAAGFYSLPNGHWTNAPVVEREVFNSGNI
ncbi:SDR family NAD(P)-dependent oxidoreductase [Sphingobium sp. EM0848]|uniref:SDR family NAD(P)-dependent oxidoreductase n=1 Tax=Sphingobium sp. EM0848 TaxID=2743473 RepID=UPI00159CB33F|nr:SDR family oxidoreductase [Sphingobium sp. EM0848]